MADETKIEGAGMSEFRKTFSESGAFMACGFAKAFLTKRGFTYGPTQSRCPTGIRFGRLKVSRWNNMTDRQKRQLDGIMAGDVRTGPITILIRDSASPAAHQAIRK